MQALTAHKLLWGERSHHVYLVNSINFKVCTISIFIERYFCKDMFLQIKFRQGSNV